MTDLERGLEVDDDAIDTTTHATADDSITPVGVRPRNHQRPPPQPGMLSTPERLRISEELKEAHRREHGDHSQQLGSKLSREVSFRASEVIRAPRRGWVRTLTAQLRLRSRRSRSRDSLRSRDRSLAESGSSSASSPNILAAGHLAEKDAIDDLKFVYRYNLLYWRARLFKYARLNEQHDGWPESCTAENINEDLERYSRAMEMYRSFCRKPGDLKDNADVRNMGRKMLEYDEAMSRSNQGSNEAAAAEEDPELAAKRLELHQYFLESVMKIGGTRVHAEMQADESASFIRNLLMALCGGFALVVPMLIMTLHSTRLTSLLTASVFVFAVALLLAWYMRETDPIQIVSVTAAYAAVLVVFVGTSTIPSTGS